MTNDFDLVEMDKLEAFAASIPNFTWSACVANPESSYPQKGYVTQHIAPGHLNEGDVDVYLCGPPPMVEAVSQFIREQGIAPANFYYEKFAASAA
ncbi:Benzoate 1,2-dioxygenase electron transfer component [compost metagenome]